MAERRRAVAPDPENGDAVTPEPATPDGTFPEGTAVPDRTPPLGPRLPGTPEPDLPRDPPRDPPGRTAATSWLGPEQDSGSRELREALETLRTILESLEQQGSAHRSRRWSPGARFTALGARWLPVGVIVLLGIGIALVIPEAAQDDSLGSPPVPRSSSPPARPEGSFSLPPTAPMRWPGGPVKVPPGVPHDGPGVDAPGTDLTIAFDEDGRHLDVFERVAFPQPRTDVRLRLPSFKAVAGPRTTVPSPNVQNLQVELDGRPARPERERDGGWMARPPGDGVTGVVGVVLRYQVDRSVLRLSGSPADRVLAVVPSLTGEDNLRDGLPVTVRISDKRVVGLSCLPGTSSGTDTAATMCAAPQGPTWTAQLPLGGAALALVQANLPA